MPVLALPLATVPVLNGGSASGPVPDTASGAADLMLGDISSGTHTKQRAQHRVRQVHLTECGINPNPT